LTESPAEKEQNVVLNHYCPVQKQRQLGETQRWVREILKGRSKSLRPLCSAWQLLLLIWMLKHPAF